MSRKTFRREDAAAQAFERMFVDPGEIVQPEADQPDTGDKGQKGKSAEVLRPPEAALDPEGIPVSREKTVERAAFSKSPANGKGNVGRKFMIPPELFSALRYKALCDPSRNLSGHVCAALEQYLQNELDYVRTHEEIKF